jgi:hypothetical protein
MKIEAPCSWCSSAPLPAAEAAPRWSKERAREWSAQQPWLVGCNFIPSTAVNQLEMWQADTFDPATIDRELGFAQGVGMNVVRVFLHDVAWEEDAAGLKQRIGRFLDLAEKHHIRVMFVLFDSCWNDAPKAGKQPAPKPGVHNSGWLRAPGSARLFDSRTWSGLEGYTKDVVGTFGRDRRVLAWDLFNEPSNSGYLDASVPLLKAVFDWAREANPDQPLTSGLWNDHAMSNDVMLDNSDVVTFHDYDAPTSSKPTSRSSSRRAGRSSAPSTWRARAAACSRPRCPSSSATTWAPSTGGS